jgi:hypothetical protein
MRVDRKKPGIKKNAAGLVLAGGVWCGELCCAVNLLWIAVYRMRQK